MRTFDEFINESYGHNNINESKKISGSKIGTVMNIKKDIVEFSFNYTGGKRKFAGNNELGAEEIEFFEDEYLEGEVGDVDKYASELEKVLTKAYSLLNADTKTIQKFIDTVKDGIFGGESYNGWMYMDQVDDKEHVETGDPEFSVTFETLLYIIAKIEVFLEYRKTISESEEPNLEELIQLTESEVLNERFDTFYSILSIGTVNTSTGSSKYFNVYETWEGNKTTVEIYKDISKAYPGSDTSNLKFKFVVTSGKGPISNRDGKAPIAGDKRSFKDDQTGRPLFQGEYVDSVLLKDLKSYGIKSATGYVYK